MEGVEAIIDNSQATFGAAHDLVSVVTNDRLGDTKREQALSKSESAALEDPSHIVMCMPRKLKEYLRWCLPSHLLHWEQ